MKDMNRRTRKDSDTSNEVPDFVFNYADADTLGAEIAEWYTYSEEPEFLWNLNAFKTSGFKKNYPDRKWTQLSAQEKKTHITRLLDHTEVSNKPVRDDACRSILYLAQGVFEECSSIDEYYKNLVDNVIVLYECDTFNVFVDLLQFEFDNLCNTFSIENKYASCITDNADLRVIMSVLYTIVEVVRSFESEVSAGRLQTNSELDAKIANIRAELKSELNKPLAKANELISSYLFQLISKFCNNNIIVLPIKKIILLLWKVLLLTMGTLGDAFNMKNELRRRFNLPPIAENPSVVLSKMPPATPPPNPIDLANEIQFSSASSYKRKKNGLTKQTRGIDSDDFSILNASTNNSGRVTQFAISSANGGGSLDQQLSNGNDDTNGGYQKSLNGDSDDKLGFNETDDNDQFMDTNSTNGEASGSSGGLLGVNSDDVVIVMPPGAEAPEAEATSVDTPRAGSPPTTSDTVNGEGGETAKTSPPQTAASEHQARLIEAANDAASIKLQLYSQFKSLPWRPKVRLAELEGFLDQERKKFFGYGDLVNDLDTMIGLPYPIQESVKILKQHLYTSLSEEQIKFEEKIAKYPLSTKDGEETTEEENPSEILFTALLSNLPQYLICLLKILLTSVPQTRPKTDSLQIMSDLFPEDLSGSHFFTVKLGIDSNRHKEILIKAISGIILLMLKHFKVNHIYQFEFVSQHLLFANCVPLILKFFNLNISSFIQSKNNHLNLDFPNCVIGIQPELNADELENGDSAVYRWRNVFSCINLLRILNKLTKYKRSRVMMLVIFKSGPILKKILRIKQATLQYYTLKLLKMQTRHLGRQWRKTNMSTMSAIYQKVRHRLNDDWAFGNEQETQGWDFQSDECALRARIDKYIQRKYKVNEETSTTNAAGAAASNGSAAINEFVPADNSLFSCLKNEVTLPEDFAVNYESWLDEEIYSNKIDWDNYLTQQDSNSIILF